MSPVGLVYCPGIWRTGQHKLRRRGDPRRAENLPTSRHPVGETEGHSGVRSRSLPFKPGIGFRFLRSRLLFTSPQGVTSSIIRRMGSAMRTAHWVRTKKTARSLRHLRDIFSQIQILCQEQIPRLD